MTPDAKMKKRGVLITESTKTFVEEEIGMELEELTETEIVKKVNKSKKAIASLKEDGVVEIKQSLNG